MFAPSGVEEQAQTQEDVDGLYDIKEINELSLDSLRVVVYYLRFVTATYSADMQAVIRRTGVPHGDVICAQLKAKVQRPAYLLILDRITRRIVLSIRGTYSLHDALTILSMGSSSRMGHRGMHKSAENFCSELLPSIRELRSKHPDFKLRIVGHSLGGAVASLLSTLLWDEFPDVRVFAFGAPPCTTASVFPRILKHVVCVINNLDPVPLLSMRNGVRVTLNRLTGSRSSKMDPDWQPGRYDSSRTISYAHCKREMQITEEERQRRESTSSSSSTSSPSMLSSEPISAERTRSRPLIGIRSTAGGAFQHSYSSPSLSLAAEEGSLLMSTLTASGSPSIKEAASVVSSESVLADPCESSSEDSVFDLFAASFTLSEVDWPRNVRHSVMLREGLDSERSDQPLLVPTELSPELETDGDILFRPAVWQAATPATEMQAGLYLRSSVDDLGPTVLLNWDWSEEMWFHLPTVRKWTTNKRRVNKQSKSRLPGNLVHVVARRDGQLILRPTTERFLFDSQRAVGIKGSYTELADHRAISYLYAFSHLLATSVGSQTIRLENAFPSDERFEQK